MVTNQKVMTNLFYIILFSKLLLARFAVSKDTDITLKLKNENVVTMVNDYTLVNKLSTSDINVLETTIELQEFKQKEKERPGVKQNRYETTTTIKRS